MKSLSQSSAIQDQLKPSFSRKLFKPLRINIQQAKWNRMTCQGLRSWSLQWKTDRLTPSGTWFCSQSGTQKTRSLPKATDSNVTRLLQHTPTLITLTTCGITYLNCLRNRCAKPSVCDFPRTRWRNCRCKGYSSRSRKLLRESKFCSISWNFFRKTMILIQYYQIRMMLTVSSKSTLTFQWVLICKDKRSKTMKKRRKVHHTLTQWMKSSKVRCWIVSRRDKQMLPREDWLTWVWTDNASASNGLCDVAEEVEVREGLIDWFQIIWMWYG